MKFERFAGAVLGSNGNVRREGEITGFDFFYRGPIEHALSILHYSDSLRHSVKMSKKPPENVRELKVFGKESKLKLRL
jgi:hypothetical protein